MKVGQYYFRPITLMDIQMHLLAVVSQLLRCLYIIYYRLQKNP
jgi:hypothetical protein